MADEAPARPMTDGGTPPGPLPPVASRSAAPRAVAPRTGAEAADDLVDLRAVPTSAASHHSPRADGPGRGDAAAFPGRVTAATPASRPVLVRATLAAAVMVLAAVVAVVLAATGSGAAIAGAVLVLVLGMAGAVAALLAARRAAVDGVDRPVQRIRVTVGRMAAGEGPVRSGLHGPTDLAALGHEIDGLADSVEVRLQRLRQQAEWGAQSRMIFEALDLVEDESEAHEVAEQALALIDAERSIELLLAPHGSTELTKVASNPGMPRPACPVDVTTSCVAIRRAQAVVFDSSESINACPKLRHRSYGPCSAACVPVSIAGRPVGVLHTVAEDRVPPEDRTVNQLATLSTQLGNRLGALRALESSRAEASTDKLTGLPNRRMLESQLGTLIERGTSFVLVIADLDKFKRLNDTYGHEVGDRALQTFAQVLRDKVRGNDVIARLGGEEFVLVYPNMSVTTSIEAIERIRDGLTQALAVSALPEFTCSFGITHSAVARSGDAIIRVADAGLLRAKELGGDQVVYADETLAAQMFGEDRGAG